MKSVFQKVCRAFIAVVIVGDCLTIRLRRFVVSYCRFDIVYAEVVYRKLGGVELMSAVRYGVAKKVAFCAFRAAIKRFFGGFVIVKGRVGKVVFVAYFDVYPGVRLLSARIRFVKADDLSTGDNEIVANRLECPCVTFAYGVTFDERAVRSAYRAFAEEGVVRVERISRFFAD